MVRRRHFIGLLALGIMLVSSAPSIGALEFTLLERAEDPRVSTAGSIRLERAIETLHSTFGYTALGLAIATGVANPSLGANETLHASLGYSASGFAIGALVTGALVHRDSLRPATAPTQLDLVHAILGVAGGVLIAVTPYLAPGDSHEALGIAGTSLMATSVLVQWLKIDL